MILKYLHKKQYIQNCIAPRDIKCTFQKYFCENCFFLKYPLFRWRMRELEVVKGGGEGSLHPDLSLDGNCSTIFGNENSCGGTYRNPDGTECVEGVLWGLYGIRKVFHHGFSAAYSCSVLIAICSHYWLLIEQLRM